MIRKRLTSAIAGLALVLSTPAVAAAAKAPETWDGLVKVDSNRLDLVYLMPNADFRAYTRVLPDRTQVAFRKNWLRDVGSSGSFRRISDAEARKIADEVRIGFEGIFAKAFEKAGYALATEAGADVLRVSTGVINLYITAPESLSPGRTRTFAVDAGEATMVIEVRDSLTGAILGRAVDQDVVGKNNRLRRTSLSNRADFVELFESWAKASVRGLDELKARSPLKP